MPGSIAQTPTAAQTGLILTGEARHTATNEGSNMITANDRRNKEIIDKQADQIKRQAEIIERYQRETADQARKIDVLEAKKR